MRRGPDPSAQLAAALPKLRLLCRSAARRCRITEDDAFQIACETALRVEPSYDPKNATGASFVTFVWSHACHAITRQSRKAQGKKETRVASAVRDAALSFAASLPSQAPRFDETDAELNARLDELKFAAAGAMFLAAMEAEVRGPDSAFESAETRARVVQALQLAMEEMEPEDREILERHSVGGEPLNELFAKVPKWRDLGANAYYAWRKLMERVGRAVWLRGRVKPRSVRAFLGQAGGG